jgi:DNA-binding transcriptional MerR regulator
MRIGELAATTGASVRSLRYYEEQQLICSRRTEGGQRVFDDHTAHRVAMIRCLIDAGVPTRDIGEMLPCVHTGDVTLTTLERLGDAHARLSAEIDERIATRERLETIIVAVRDNTCSSTAVSA